MTGAAPPEPTLLVVDDEESVAATLAAVLEADGYRVQTAGTVGEALARIAETAFTAAVLDLDVGADDGLVVLARLKETSPATVAVVLTGYASVGSALGAIRAGVDGYLVKPCDITELKATLTRGRERVERAAAERAALLGAVAEARERLTVVIEHLPVGVILAEAPSGRLLLGNRAVERIWRQPFPGATDAGQRAGARGFHVDGRPYLPEDWPLARAIASGAIVRGELIEIVRGDGTRGAIRNHAAPLRDAEGRIVAGVVVFEDVTEELAARRASATAADRTARLERLAGVLARALRPAEAAEAVLRALRPALGAPAGLVALAVPGRPGGQPEARSPVEPGSPAAATLEIVASAGVPPELIERWRRFPSDGPAAAAGAYRERRLIAFGSPAEAGDAPDAAALMAATGHEAIVAAPLLVDERALGAFVVAFESRRRFDAAERDFALAVAAQCAQALDRARLHGQTEQAERHQRLVADASRLLAEARLDQSAVLETLARTVAATVADTCTIHLVEDDAATLRLAAVHDPDPARAALRRALLAEHPLRVGEGMAGGVVQSGQPVVVLGDRAAFEATLKPEYRPHADRLFFHSVAVVPLRGQHGVVGALAAERLGAGRLFGQPDVDLLQEIADRAALAIENARLYAVSRRELAERERAEEAQRRAAERMRRLQEITQQISRSLDAEEVLTSIAESAASLLEAPVAAVFLLDRADAEADFVLAAAHGIDEARAAGLRLPRHASLAGRAVDEGRVRAVEDVGTTPGTALPRLLTGQLTGSEIAAPITGGQEQLGVVKAFWPSGRRFRPDDAELLAALAAAAAVALTNARLYREAREAIAARDEFLSIAAHELRTPVTSLRGNAQLLARAKGRGRLDEARIDRFVSAIVDSTTRLASLIDDLLDVSRMQSGQLALRRREVDLCALVGQIVEARAAATGPAHRLEATLPAAGCRLAADPDRLAQVVENLLDNAVKYSPDGGLVRIDLEVGGGEAHLRVGDEGIGLPAGSGDEIFEPFGRATNAVERALPGMGLGLYICRSIVERHGGRLWAESPGEDRGTTLHLALPGIVAGETDGLRAEG